MNPKPLSVRLYKTAAARDAAELRARDENPDTIIIEAGKLFPKRGEPALAGPYFVARWEPLAYLQKLFPGATLREIVEAVRENRDRVVVNKLDRSVAGAKGATATASKGAKHREKIRAAYQDARLEYPDAKKTWLVKIHLPSILPKSRGYGPRSIAAVCRDLK